MEKITIEFAPVSRSNRKRVPTRRIWSCILYIGIQKLYYSGIVC